MRESSDGKKTKISLRLLRAICLCVLLCILVVGLWPFHSPKNEVSWQNQRNGIHFGKHGSVASVGTFRADGPANGTSCGIEMWLEPSRIQTVGTILAFYRRSTDLVPFMIRQSVGDLVLQRASPTISGKNTRIYVDDVLSSARPIFLAISSDTTATFIYVDGELVRKIASFTVSKADLTGQLILGNSPTAGDNWGGKVYGLSIYNRALSEYEVSEHFADWNRERRVASSKIPGVAAIYLFNESKGRVAHNQVDPTTDLVIPERFFILHERFLELPWDEYHPGLAYWKDVAINILGFVPLGFFYSLYLSSVRHTKTVAGLTITLGFVVSLTIEILQAFLPTRDSGVTDLITNTLGTCAGVLLCGNRSYHTVLRK
jgi:VanZ family protein